ncbi:MAG: HDOD domain-containing protein [Azonexus sp.]|nr:HDOD domain-containing protein [Azonexus sp.]MDZ4315427.1 HDOD domain-containing protein [Azonexus sp.]
MPSADALFIAPLLGPDDAWSGYIVEFAPGHANPEALNELCDAVLTHHFDQRHHWLIPAVLGSNVKNVLGERTITVFPALSGPFETEALKQYEASLRQSRCNVGLLTTPEIALPGAGAWHCLVISASHARSLPPLTLIGQASRSTIVATEVHSQSDREWTVANACALSTTEYLLARQSTGKKADMSRLKLLEMLALIAEDADTAKLDAIFRQESKLSYSLLRLVNSAAVAPRNPITSFAQAINLLGRRQLQRWLQLLVYADPNNGQQPNPLLQKAAARGRQLELLAQHLTPPPAAEHLGDAAFMVGTFSLLDALLNMPMQEILLQLPLSPIVQEALTKHIGGLGELLLAIDAAENGDFKRAADQISDLGISSAAHRDAQLASYSWASKIRSAV